MVTDLHLDYTRNYLFAQASKSLFQSCQSMVMVTFRMITALDIKITFQDFS